MLNNFCDSHFKNDIEPLKQISLDNFLSLDGLRILVVDDNVDNRLLVEIIFQQYQAQVKTAVSVDEAIKVIEEWKPDVLVSDICMQGKDGYWLIRYIRNKEAEVGGFIPAVALTGYVFPEERSLAFDAGFQILISKPFDPDRLVAVVAKLTSSTREKTAA